MKAGNWSVKQEYNKLITTTEIADPSDNTPRLTSGTRVQKAITDRLLHKEYADDTARDGDNANIVVSQIIISGTKLQQKKADGTYKTLADTAQLPGRIIGQSTTVA